MNTADIFRRMNGGGNGYSHAQQPIQSIGFMKKQLLEAGIEIDKDTDIAKEFNSLNFKKQNQSPLLQHLHHHHQQHQQHNQQDDRLLPSDFNPRLQTRFTAKPFKNSDPSITPIEREENVTPRDRASYQHQAYSTPQHQSSSSQSQHFENSGKLPSDIRGRTPAPPPSRTSFTSTNSNNNQGTLNLHNVNSQYGRGARDKHEFDDSTTTANIPMIELNQRRNQHSLNALNAPANNKTRKQSDGSPSEQDQSNRNPYARNIPNPSTYNNYQFHSKYYQQQHYRNSSASASSNRGNNSNQYRQVSPIARNYPNEETMVKDASNRRSLSNSSVNQYRYSSTGRATKPNYNNNYTPREMYSENTDQQRSLDRSLLDTARALSTSKQQQQQQQPQYASRSMGHRIESMFSRMLASSQVFGKPHENQEHSQQSKYFKFDRFEQVKRESNKKSMISTMISCVSWIETSHIIMAMMAFLFVFFFSQNVHEYFSSQRRSAASIRFCDSTMRPEAVQSSNAANICLPCPTHAICLQGHVECKHAYVLVGGRCIVNPQIETATVEYLTTVVDHFKKVQAEYYCYDSHSSGYGTTFTRAYKEHKWPTIEAVLLSVHGRDPLYFETLAKVQSYLSSKSIREQFEIEFDTTRDTFFVSVFNPSYYCRARLWVIQNKTEIFTLFFAALGVLVLAQTRFIRAFMYSVRQFRAREQINNQEEQQAQQYLEQNARNEYPDQTIERNKYGWKQMSISQDQQYPFSSTHQPHPYRMRQEVYDQDHQ